MSDHTKGSGIVEGIDMDSLFITQQQQHQHNQQETPTTTRKPHRNRNISFKVLDRRKLINRHRHQNHHQQQEQHGRALSPIGMAYTPVATPPPLLISDEIQQHQMNSASSYPSLKRLSLNSLPHIFEDDDNLVVDKEVKSFFF